MSDNKNRIFGIDLGTTYSCIAYVNDAGKTEVVPNADGDLTTPSVVYFEDSDTVIVGKAAKEELKMNPDRVITLVKRLMGEPGRAVLRNRRDPSHSAGGVLPHPSQARSGRPGLHAPAGADQGRRNHVPRVLRFCAQASHSPSWRDRRPQRPLRDSRTHGGRDLLRNDGGPQEQPDRAGVRLRRRHVRRHRDRREGWQHRGRLRRRGSQPWRSQLGRRCRELARGEVLRRTRHEDYPVDDRRRKRGRRFLAPPKTPRNPLTSKAKSATAHYPWNESLSD